MELNRKETLKMIGESVKSRRLSLNLTQQETADRSGVSIRVIKRMEAGDGSSLESLIAVSRTLQKTGWLEEFKPATEISPLAMAEALKHASKPQRRRASGRRRDV